MEIDDVRLHIGQWIKSVLSVPSPMFNNLPPCPYSREAWFNDKVDLRLVSASVLPETILEIGRGWDDSHVLVLLAGDRSQVTPEEIARRMTSVNVALEPWDLISFFDHPDTTDAKFRVASSNGKYLLAGIQRLGAFVQAAKPLYKRSYFDKATKQFSTEKHLGKPA